MEQPAKRRRIELWGGLLLVGVLCGTNMLGWVLDLTPPPWMVWMGDPDVTKARYEHAALGYVIVLALLGAGLSVVVSYRRRAAQRRRGVSTSFAPTVLAAAVFVAGFGAAMTAPIGHRDVEIIPPAETAAGQPR